MTTDFSVQRMADSHENRYGAPFWELFDSDVQPRLPDSPVVVDLGCGPGLFLQDLSRRLPGATLYGLDLSQDMVDRAKTLDYGGATVELTQHDLTRPTLPMADGSVDLVTVVSVLCFIDDTFPILVDVRRVLKPGGTFLLLDWVRHSLEDYLAGRIREGGQDHQRRMQRFPLHNRYTVEDWRWLLDQERFEVLAEAAPRESHRAFVATPQ